MACRVFTPTAARRVLRRIRPTAERICRVYRELETRLVRPVRSDQRVDPAYFVLVRDLVSSIDMLRRRGIEVRDPKLGLLEFPARRDGRAVRLSWKVGEPALQFWHEPGAGVDERRRVDDDGPWDGSDPGGTGA